VNHRILLLALGLSAATAGTAAAQGTALALRAGSFGPSLGLTTSFGGMINARLDAPYFSYSRTDRVVAEDFDIDIDSSVRLFSVSGLVDLHPFRNGLRLSAGAIYNGIEATFTGRSATSQTVRGRTYSPEEIGTLTGHVEMGSKIAPYAGIGFGNPVAFGKRFGFVFDLGVMFQGPPRVIMSGTGMVEPTAQEVPQIEENLDWMKMYPGLSIGLTYRIF
jgi:hypothetical protein